MIAAVRPKYFGMNFLAPHATAEAAALLADRRTSIEFFDYDWTLNDIAR